MSNKKFDICFWDWNGTLLNDTDVCVAAMNKMLRQRGRPEIDVDYYKSIFGFPVREYYLKLGFDFKDESFEALSVEFIDNYNYFIFLAGLQPFSVPLLEHYSKAGITQVVISAMEQKMLNAQLNKYGVSEYFADAKGISDIYAKDKSHLAIEYINEHKLRPERILFIGDTIHDHEVAEKIGAEVVLVSNGHQSSERLTGKSAWVISDLNGLLRLN